MHLSTLHSTSPLASTPTGQASQIAWSPYNGQYGTIILGLQNGGIQIYDVNKWINNEPSLVYEEQVYEAKVESI
jgi:hypothetical protein